MILKDQKSSPSEEGMHVQYLLDLKHMRTEKLGAAMVCVEGIRKELFRMMDMAGKNVHEAFDTVEKRSKDMLAGVLEREEYVDFLNKEISRYITSAVSFETTTSGSRVFNSLFTITGNIERISDHATNIAGYSRMLAEKHIVFSKDAGKELEEMQETCQRLFALLQETPGDYKEWHSTVACIEQQMDDMTEQFRNNMYARLQGGTCSDEGSVLFSEMLTDFERIGDHALNIADEVLKTYLRN